ncbi:carbon-nitrogen family hydrolase [Jatrophihabitans sp. YIM 134969]
MDVRIVQVSYGDSESLGERVERVGDLVREQRGADLVVLPELWAHGGFSYQSWQAEAEGVDGATVEAMRRAARDAEVVLHAGSIIERDPVTGALFNTAVVVDRAGEVNATYRKIHRFGFDEGEPRLLSAGHQLVTPALHLADDVVITGLATCYDLRFPEMFRMLTVNGVSLVIVAAAWPLARLSHWRLLAQARAVENQVFVIACNTAGTHAGAAMGGHSMIVDPLGHVVAEAGDGEEVLRADIALDAVQAARMSFPVLANRRF